MLTAELTGYVIFGHERADLEMNSLVSEGLVGSNGDVHVKTLSHLEGVAGGGELTSEASTTINGHVVFDGEVRIKKDSVVNGNIDAGGQVTVDKNTTVSGDVTSGNEVSIASGASIAGTVAEFGSPDAFSTIIFPDTTSFNPDLGNPISTAKGVETNLPPGIYGEADFGQNNILNLSAGEYVFDQFIADNGLQLNLDVSDGEIALFVRSDVELQKDVDVELVGGDAGQVFLETHGEFKLAKDSEWFGTILASGDVNFEKNATYVGAAYSRTSVKIGKDGSFALVPANRLLTDTVPTVTVDPLLTTDTTPELTGHVDDPAADIQVTVSGDTFDAQNNGDGTWTLADNTIDPPLGEGTYDVQVSATNASGNVGTDSTTDELIVVDAGAILLQEGDTFLVDASTLVDLGQPEGSRTISLQVDTLFDTSDEDAALEDHLLVSLVDPANLSQTLLDRGVPGTTLFSLANDRSEFPPGLVSYNGSVVQIDVTQLQLLDAGTLLFQLINTDNDFATVAAISNLTNEVDDEGSASPILVPRVNLSPIGGELDLATLNPTEDVDVLVDNVRVDSNTGRFSADLHVRNGGSSIGRQVAVVFPGLPADVEFVDASGTDATGAPYINMATAITPGGLLNGERSNKVNILIDNPNSTQFRVAANVLVGAPNQAPDLPEIGTLTAVPGDYLEVPLGATDPNGDPLTFSLDFDTALPSGMLKADGTLIFAPGPGDEGIYPFSVIASDGAETSTVFAELDVQADPVGTTRVSGVVRNTQQEPLEGVPISLSRLTALTNADGSFTIELPSHLFPTERFDISVPLGDVYFDPSSSGQETIEFRRAQYDTRTGSSETNPRRHPNLVSSFLDGSVVYGSDDARASALRTLDGTGRLKTSPGDLLPFNNTEYFPDGPLENDAQGSADPTSLFVSGDVRSSENPALAALHTVLLREHNRLADTISSADPSLTDEEVYQGARRIVIAELQHITYSEYLPLLLGPNAIAPYAGYDPTVDPTVGALFSTAAFRHGHSQATPEIERRDAEGNLLAPISIRDGFFNTDPIVTDGIDVILRGIASQVAEEVDTKIISELRNSLFGPPGSGGVDLVSMSLQRGRDVGLPSYNQARIDLGLASVTAFSQITSNVTEQQALQATYGNVNQIDVFAGGLAEDRLPDAMLGELFSAVVADQFERTRNGDRFWYENSQFSANELMDIRATTLATLIERNTGLTGLPTSVFTTMLAPTAPAAAGQPAGTPPTETREIDGSENNLAIPSLGSTGQYLRIDASLNYDDGISSPAGPSRPSARIVSNNVFDQTTSIRSANGSTAMFVSWGQLITHDLSLTPTGISDTLKIHGDQAPGTDVTYPFVAEKIDLLLGHPLYEDLNNVIARPIFLPGLDVANGLDINPAVNNTVTTPMIPDMSLFIAANTIQDQQGQPFSGRVSITQVPTSLTPAALPKNLRSDLVVTIQPAELVFTIPAPITFPNSAGYAPGTILNLWSINPVTGLFDDVGDMQVSPDGTLIETISGGVINSSWHFPAPPDPEPEDDDDGDEDNDCEDCKETAGNFEVELHSGAVLEDHALVTYQSMGQSRGLNLHYDSLRADPRPIVHINYSNLQPDDSQRLVASLEFMLDDFAFQVPGHPGGELGLQGGEHFWKLDVAGTGRVALQADFTTLPSGTYPYQLTSGPLQFDGEKFAGTTITQTKELRIVNTAHSPFGAGWGLTGLWNIVEDSDGSVLLIDGGGSELYFETSANPDDSLVSPAGDFSRLVKLSDGTYQRTMPDQTVYRFNTNHQVESMTDRNGNMWTYEYNADGIISRITDPADLETLFSSSNGRVDSITDPANRVTALEYDAGGNLIRVTDPDHTSRQWGYDIAHRITSHTDKRGFTEEVFYDFAGRAQRSIRKDGTEQFYDPVQTQVLRPVAETTDPVDPASVSTITQIKGRYADPNGNVREVLLDKQGQARQRTDSEGSLGGVMRDDENLITMSSDGRGFPTELSYDERGNVLSITESVPAFGSGGVVLLPYDPIGEPVIRDNLGFSTATLGPNDDGSTGHVPIGFDVNFFGDTYSQLFVNNNGNVTFDSSLSTFTPFDLLSTSRVIIAPFFADVDTRGTGTVTYGMDNVLGRDAFAVTWDAVGYYSARTDLTNTFQLVIVDRSDVEPGAFDFELNFFDINWETGDASGGSGGLGGNSARAGYSNGSDAAFEISGSAVNGALLDDNEATGLIHGSRNSTIDGRYRFEVRGGEVVAARTEYTYDDKFSQITTIIDELGHQTLRELDPATGNVVRQTRVIGEVDGLINGETDDLVTTMTYAQFGLIDTITDELGRITDFDYNARGLVTSVTYAIGTPDEATITYDYDLAGNRIAMIDGEANSTEYDYDALNRLIRIVEQDPDGVGPLISPVSVITYDRTGNVETTTDANGNTAVNGYDELDRLVEVMSPDPDGDGPLPAAITTYSYDPAGNLKSMADPNGHLTIYRYDGRNRRIAMTDPDGGFTRYSYDTDNNLSILIDPAGNATRFTYDARDRMVSEIDPLNNQITYVYDGADNLISKTDRNNRKTQFTYDDVDRLITEEWISPGNTVINTISYSYDAASNLLNVIDNHSSLTYAYDARDRTTSVSNNGTPDVPEVVLTYTYDNNSNVISASDTIDGDNAVTTSYAYDALDRLTQLTQAGPNTAGKRADFTYNSSGQYETINRFRGLADTQLAIETSYAYDDVNRLTRIDHKNDLGAIVAFYAYDYDSASRITRITDVDGTTNYAYDNRNQLIGATHPDSNQLDESYEYDAGGSRVSSHLHGSDYETGLANRLLSDGIFDYEYDAEGNLTTRTDTTTGDYRLFRWDHRNRLLSIQDFRADDTATQVVSFAYDAIDRRISKSVDTTPEDVVDAEILHFVYDREDVILDFLDADGNGPAVPILAERYLHGPGIDQVLAQDDGKGNTFWLLSDHLGTVRDLVDADGIVASRISYDGFGNVTSNTRPDVRTRYTFAGRELDAETDLYFNRLRYYDANVGTFLSEDPLGAGEGDNNRRRYALNRPVRLIDPSGADAIYVEYEGYPISTVIGTYPLGHAAVIGINPVTGATEYYEFGRYYGDESGIVRRCTIPDVAIGSNGLPTESSLQNLYSYISTNYGKSKPVEATYRAETDYRKVTEFAKDFAHSHDPYGPLSNNCKTFAADASQAGNETSSSTPPSTPRPQPRNPRPGCRTI